MCRAPEAQAPQGSQHRQQRQASNSGQQQQAPSPQPPPLPLPAPQQQQQQQSKQMQQPQDVLSSTQSLSQNTQLLGLSPDMLGLAGLQPQPAQPSQPHLQGHPQHSHLQSQLLLLQLQQQQQQLLQQQLQGSTQPLASAMQVSVHIVDGGPSETPFTLTGLVGGEVPALPICQAHDVIIRVRQLLALSPGKDLLLHVCSPQIDL